MSDAWLALLVAGPALLALGVTAIAARTWPRGARGEPLAGRISVLIPARDEERSIGDALRSALAEPVDEVLVYDDQSRDATGAIADAIAREDVRARRIAGGPLEAGWVGKAHACHRLAEHARGDWLVYVDADVRLARGAIERLGEVARTLGADVVTAVPRQETETWMERLVVPLLHLIYTSWLPAPLVWASRDERMLMANGQLLAIRRDALAALGGWEAVRRELVEDMALCRAAKRAGLRVVFADGHEMARCRMYRSAREVWEGFTKNLFEGLGESPAALVLAVGLHVHAFVVPVVALGAGLVLGGEGLVAGGAIGVAANVTQRAWLTYRHHQPIESIVTQPLAIVMLAGIAAGSWWRSARGRVEWRGRSYAPRRARGS